MRMSIITRGFELTEALRAHVSRRTAFALSRFGQVVKQVQIRLSDLNGPRGGEDKQCIFLVEMIGTAPVVIRERDADAYTAIDRAADRVERAVSRTVRRRRGSFSRTLPIFVS